VAATVAAGSVGGPPGAGFAVGCAHPAGSAAATIPAVTATVINGFITELHGDRSS